MSQRQGSSTISADVRAKASTAAGLVTEIFAPAVLVTAMLLFAGVYGTGMAGLPPTLVAITFVTGIPFVAVFVLARRGTVADHHIADRRQRAPVLLGTLVSIAAGAYILTLMDPPPSLVLMIGSTVLGVVLVMVVNLFWKLSAHAAVGVFFSVASMTLMGPWAVITVLVPASVGWSRVVLGAHTRRQVVWGFAVGLVVGLCYAAAEDNLLTLRS